ncbi:retrovirus-related Pol polyprotein LINE-1 [Elysia marginata]|uniref:Retrovirus-related Pol polyprotein LINE-1 n=1 Tax=Elysia marginata TaxID=1093978 RepID=A0AAV4FU80_9GAST|nr:retrovirus-related Pol polyprotein LINE-1 [Elysia marginata]
MLMSIRSKIRPEIAESQFGSIPDKGTRNATIFTLSMLMERAVELQRDVYVCFIDYSKAFDKVKHSELFGILDQLNIDGKDLRILRNLYWEQVAAIRIDGEYTNFTEIKRGVRQGCVLSPDMFNLYSEVILRNITDMEDVKVGGRNITNLRYADDSIFLANSQENLQALLSVVTYESESMGLQLNARKTECMVVSKKQVKPHCVIHCKNTTKSNKWKNVSILALQFPQMLNVIKKLRKEWQCQKSI